MVEGSNSLSLLASANRWDFFAVLQQVMIGHGLVREEVSPRRRPTRRIQNRLDMQLVMKKTLFFRKRLDNSNGLIKNNFNATTKTADQPPKTLSICASRNRLICEALPKLPESERFTVSSSRLCLFQINQRTHTTWAQVRDSIQKRHPKKSLGKCG